MRTQARMLVRRAATRLRAGLRTRRGKVLAIVALLVLVWNAATFTAQHIADSVLVTVEQATQVATVDGDVTIERKAIYNSTLSGDGAARMQAILNAGRTEPGPLTCPQTRLASAPREYQFWFYYHDITIQYVQAGDPGCVIRPTTLGVPSLLLHIAPTPTQWDTIDGMLGLAPLQP